MNSIFSMTRRCAMCWLGVLSLSVAAAAARAADIEYANSSGAQDFTDGANWVGGVAPGANDVTLIHGVDGITDFPFLDSEVSIQAFQVGSGDGATGGLEIRNGGVLTTTATTNHIVGGVSGGGGVGHLRIQDGASVNVAGTLVSGGGSGQGTITIDGGQIVAQRGINAGALDTGAVGTITMNGGSLEAGVSLTLGGRGTGTFYMNGGTLTTDPNLAFRLGFNGGSGTFIQTGGDVIVNSGTSIQIAAQTSNQAGIRGFYEISGGSLNLTTGGTGNLSVGAADGLMNDELGTFKIIGDVATISTDRLFDRISGTLAFEIGSGISPIDVISDANLLDGELDVSFTQTPSVGQQFTIINYGMLNGTFGTFDTQVDSPLGPDTVGLSIDYGTLNASSIVLTVDSVVPTLVAGDYNGNGVVDAADYTVWRDNLDSNNPLPNDPLGTPIRQAHYDQWKAHFGQTIGSGSLSNATVPEPASAFLLLLGAAFAACRLRRVAPRVPSTHKRVAHANNPPLKNCLPNSPLKKAQTRGLLASFFPMNLQPARCAKRLFQRAANPYSADASGLVEAAHPSLAI